jgi:hypothetical protein
MKRIMDATVEELEEVLRTNSMDGYALDGIEERKDFDKLFKSRLNPRTIATSLLKDRRQEQRATHATGESPDLVRERLEVKRIELELKKTKVTSQTWFQEQTYKRMQAIEDAISVLMSLNLSNARKLDALIMHHKIDVPPQS